VDDFNPKFWLDIAQHNPILLVILVGLAAGSGVTQAVKKTWLAFGDVSKVTQARYRASCTWLSIIVTAFCTYMMFHSIIFTEVHGFGKALAAANGMISPLSYKLTKSLIAWKFPSIAAGWGENGAGFKALPEGKPP
jgi:hypothetical protein